MPSRTDRKFFGSAPSAVSVLNASLAPGYSFSKRRMKLSGVGKSSSFSFTEEEELIFRLVRGLADAGCLAVFFFRLLK